MRRARRGRDRGAAGAVLALLTVCPLGAADSTGPELRPGLWRFERSFEYADHRPPGEPVTAELCMDPSQQADETLAMFRRMGCEAERRRSGRAEWRLEVRCDRPELPRGSSTSVLTVQGTSAYEVRVVNAGGMAMPIVRELLRARRLGDC